MDQCLCSHIAFFDKQFEKKLHFFEIITFAQEVAVNVFHTFVSGNAYLLERPSSSSPCEDTGEDIL